NSGKSPDAPMASLAALLRAYPLTGGDTVYVDTGSYTLPTNILVPAADAAAAANNPLLITGPTDGQLAVLNRNNTAAGSYVFDIEGANNLNVDNLSMTGAYHGVVVGGGADGVVLQNDDINDNVLTGVELFNSAGASGLQIIDSSIHGNGRDGVTINGGNGS